MWSFYLLTTDRVALARLTFQQLKVINPETGDRLFEAFGTGMPVNQISQPFERFHDYEQLLNMFHSDDSAKYKKLHKGTAFFFLGWAAFDMRNYTKAVYYLDNAISEDIRNFPDKWEGMEGANALRLFLNDKSPIYRVVKELYERVDMEIKRFNKDTGSTLTIEDFINKFVIILQKSTGNKSTRSIVTALYTFLFEFEDRSKELKLRSGRGGSMEPILNHLFKGGLIFESLLKKLYPGVKTLGGFNFNSTFTNDFCRVSTSAHTLKVILNGINTNDLKTAFDTTAKLRNTSGHNLVWDDIFDKTSNYEVLYHQIVNAILFIVVKKYQ